MSVKKYAVDWRRSASYSTHFETNKRSVSKAKSSDAGSRVKLLVIPTDEERAIAGDTYEVAMAVKEGVKEEG